MANKIMKFHSEVFGDLRGHYLDGQAWLVAKEVCKALKLNDVYQAVSRLGDDERMTISSGSSRRKRGGARIYNLINEAGFYHLFFSCRGLPSNAQEFKRWLGQEVFPTIRRAGSATIPRCVYALLMSNQTVKIGQTQYFERRLRQIELSAGLTVVKHYHTDYLDGQTARRIEKALHLLFADKRILGEFFNVTFEDAKSEMEAWRILTE